MNTVSGHALSYIQTIAQLVDPAQSDSVAGITDEMVNYPKISYWSCASDHRSVTFCPSMAAIGEQGRIQSKHAFDICIEPCSSAQKSVSGTNLDALLWKAIEG